MTDETLPPGPWVAKAEPEFGDGAPITIFSRDGSAIYGVAGDAPPDINGGITAATLQKAAAATAIPDLIDALKSAESFMSGFQDDELQEGINERLAKVRAALASAGRPTQDPSHRGTCRRGVTSKPLEYALSIWADTRNDSVTRERAALIAEGLKDTGAQIPFASSADWIEGWEAAIETVAMFLRFKDAHL